MNIQNVRAQCSRLASDAADRYRRRAAPRQAVLDEVEKSGVFAAAGPAASVARVAHMTPAEGRDLATPRSFRAEGAAPPARIFEANVGPDDSDPVNFLARGERAARAVCRLVFDRQAVGTGFLVAPGLLLTNNHVIPDEADAKGFLAEFDYELNCDDQPRAPVVRFALDPDHLFATSDFQSGLDFSFVAVKPTSIDGRPISDFGWLPLDPRVNKILIGEPAVIIQHPRGDHKRVCLFSAELEDKLDDYLQYTTDTDHGSSGSCVANRSWQVVALHHASTTSDRRRRGRPVIVNEGVRVSSILNALETSTRVRGTVAAIYQSISRPEIIADGRPQSPVTSSPTRPAQPADERSRATDLEARTNIRTQPDDHFDNRAAADFGYKPGFLGSGFSVPLPGLPDFLADDTTGPTNSAGVRELKYTHYSVVHSVSRRLPIITAVNIDGARSQRLPRTDRDFEAADKWFYDPRIPRALQLEPGLYDRTDFAFGHLVRREDPVWGDLNTSRMANDDTFYMTNCAPQHNTFNSGTWLKLENAILNAARNKPAKVSVFTGPVLAPQDPEILGVQVPTAFWKIVAYRESGQLRAHGFMQFQTALVAGIVVRPEALTGLDKAKEFKVRIRDIARATSLDFGPLLAADVLGADPESRRPLTSDAIDSLFTGADSTGEPPATTEPRATSLIEPRGTTPAIGLSSLRADLDAASALREIQRILSRYSAAPNGPAIPAEETRAS